MMKEGKKREKERKKKVESGKANYSVVSRNAWRSSLANFPGSC